MANLFKYPVEVEDKAVALYEDWFSAKTFHFRKVLKETDFYSLDPEEQYAWRYLAKTILDKEKDLQDQVWRHTVFQ